MDDILELADRLWRGETEIANHHPLGGAGGLTEVTPDIAYVASFARVSAFKTEDGLVLVDTGSALAADHIHEVLRQWAPATSGNRLNTAVFSHGHIDHVFGVAVFEQESDDKSWAPPQVVAHEAMPARFDRYVMTAGYNGIINRRQFSLPNLTWPTEYRYPDRTYRESLDVEVGGRLFELHHARGETDDHTWTWIPDRKALCTGDLFIWASPNAGNPQKVQRYPLEWAQALRTMQQMGAEMLLPGHGFPVMGSERVAEALTTTADLLESIVTQTLAMMNSGARLNDVIHGVEMPADLLALPWLRPVYDDPEFIVRNLWRQYGGWYDGDPSSLKPAPAAKLAAELAALAGGANRLAARAEELLAAGTDEDLRLAGHLAELAAMAAPADEAVHRVRAGVFSARVEAETSTMAKGIFRWAAAESRPAHDH
ncbi:MAG TPA: alkyl sulfatase dimerization domain-containing protein [Acidimicrobiales bacterium]|jgi:alkyl sulfatase BDS1-like metallo-beta-lactamase superfamily hydrolase|nr:alkyl sulfatase dimerization domain-containing protein [Acidimicrobiales bacterium]